MSNPRGDLVAKISKAASFSEQAQLVSELDDYDQNLRSEAAAARELDMASAIIQQTLVPVRVHEMHTAATDWIADFEPSPDTTMAHHASIAEAAMWFGRVSPEVKADFEEFGIQAEGFMRREASRHGEQAQSVYEEGLSYLGFLYRRLAASGLDQIQQVVNPHEDPAPTPLPTDVFDNFAPEVAPINTGVVGTEGSERAPLLQLIEQSGNGSGAPEKPGGHSTSEDTSGGYSEVPAGNPEDNSSGPMGTEGWDNQSGPQDAEEPDEHNEEFQARASWDQRSVAISHSMNMDEFNALQSEAASGLDQVQQIVNPHEDPAPTPLPVQVMFPWLISPDAYGTQGAEPEVEVGQGPADVAESANPYRASRKQAAEEDLGNAGRPYDPDCHQCFEEDPSLFGKGRDEYHAKGRSYTGECEHSRWGGKESSRKQADMYGNSDLPHPVPGPSPANNPSTRPNEQSGYQQGFDDARSGQRPTFADASSGAPSHVQQYAEGYSAGVNAQKPAQGSPAPQDVPVSLGGDNGQNVTNGDTSGVIDNLSAAAKVSDRFVKAASRKNPEFTKGYGYSSKWEPGKPLVTMGSAEFEAGLFAGLIDSPANQQAWVSAHYHQAKKDKRFARRMTTYSQYMDHLASQGISVEAGTSTDLDTMDLSTSPSLSGQTPINGRGQEGPLAGGMDPAEEGGPAPYNGAPPFGSPVVPTGPNQSASGSQYVNDVVGGPVDGNVNSATIAFRRRVQASLLTASKKG
jgi:hypothetical protein